MDEEITDFDRLFEGEDYLKRTKEFWDKLLVIESNYPDFFKDRKDKNGNPDTIGQHFRMYEGALLTLTKDLPNVIEDECFALHKSVFSSKE